MMRLSSRIVFCTVFLLFISALSFAQVKDKSTFLLDGFEDGNFWKTVNESDLEWTSSNMATECSISTEWSTQGKKCASLSFGPMNKVHQSSFACTELFEPDWGKYKEIVIDFYNKTDQKISVNIAFQNKENWKWTVCKSATLEVGENKDVRFSLTENIRDGKNSKCEPIQAGNELYCALIQVIGNNKGGTLLVDNIRLIK
ncbi:MAG: hypothetical protein IKQ43_05980 [Treponema sp.]|nr:hypothetical protein [Treponema sp.]